MISRLLFSNVMIRAGNNIEMLEWLDSIEVECDMKILGGHAAEHNSRAVLEWMLVQFDDFELSSYHLNFTISHPDLFHWMHEEKHISFNYVTMYCIAQSGNMELLQSMAENGEDIDNKLLSAAAQNGSMKMVRWLRDEWGLEWAPQVCEMAATGGHLSLLQYLRSEGCEWDSDTTYQAAIKGHLSVLQWAVENDCPLKYETIMLGIVASRGHVDVLQFLYNRNPKLFLCNLSETDAVGKAARNGHLSVLQFLYPLWPTHYSTVLLQAARGHTPLTLMIVRWTIEHTVWKGCIAPLELYRENMRLDVIKYLEEEGLMKKK